MSDYGHELQFGVFITPSAATAERVVELAVLADEEGLDLVTFQDHPYQPRLLDTVSLLAFVAARTRRVHLAANVLNLPLRQPAVLARAVAALDILSGGRAELGIGAGGFWDAIEAMGGARLSPGQSVTALEEAIDVISALWDTGRPGHVHFEGKHYRLLGAARGPAPVHDVGIWIGAYKPRMLRLVGRKATGWLPSLPYLQPGDLESGNATIDEAAASAGRAPSEIRRLLNVTGGLPVEELARLALEDGVGTFILMGDDPASIQAYAAEVAPAVRTLVAAERSRSVSMRTRPTTSVLSAKAEPVPADEYLRLGVTPTPAAATRLSSRTPWDESKRPRRPRSDPGVEYTERGRLIGKHLIDVHDMLRRELTELREILVKVREGALTAGSARSALNEMALRQNDWALGAFCSRYCGVVTQHHGLEDSGVFPHLAKADPTVAPVIQRLKDEHLVIHDAIQAVDEALVEHVIHPGGFTGIEGALDFLTDSLLSHLSYEEEELVEPLARVGFYGGQI